MPISTEVCARGLLLVAYSSSNASGDHTLGGSRFGGGDGSRVIVDMSSNCFITSFIAIAIGDGVALSILGVDGSGV